MKVAVISDIHENFNNLLRALEIMRQRGVEKILCLGDFIHPGIVKVLVDCDIPVFSIWGNNDGDKVTIVKMSLSDGSSLELGDKTYASLEIDGRKIFLTHYPDLALPLARSGMYDIVFYGHDHLKSEDRAEKCPIVNPGELSANKTKTATFAIYDTVSNEYEFVEVDNVVTLTSDYVEDFFARS
jgi:putative phosphoesterase